MMSKKLPIVGFLMLLAFTFSCSGDMLSSNSDPVQGPDATESFAKKSGPTIVPIAQGNPAFSTLVCIEFFKSFI